MVSKFDLECVLIIFIYFNSNFKVTCKNEDFENRCFPKQSFRRRKPKICTISVVILLFFTNIRELKNCHPEYVRVCFLWESDHQTRFKMVPSNSSPNNAKFEIIDLKHVSYTQPIWVSLTLFDPFADGSAP